MISCYVSFVVPYTASLPRDYTFAVSELSFTPTISRVCRDVSIEDDTVVDDTEFFTVSLESIDNVMVNGFTTVQITDDDGELYNTNVHVYNCYQQERRKWSGQSGNGRTTFQRSNNRQAHNIMAFLMSLAEDIYFFF